MSTYTPYTDNVFLADFGKRLAHFRLANNWTQADLAQKAGVSKGTVERLERGESSQLLNLVKILRACGFLDAFLSIFPDASPSPIKLLKISQQQQKNTRKRASRKQKTNGPSSIDSAFPPSSATYAAEPKSAWVWEEDK